MESIEVTREELYEIVWTTPLYKLAQQYALSNDGIKKICKEFYIPMPDRSYWSKIKFNNKFKREKLNSVYGSMGKIVLPIRPEGSPVNVDQTPLTIRTKEIEYDPKAPLKVPAKILKPDLLTIQTEEYWKESKGNIFYDKYKKLRYPIRVSEKQKKRALCFMDAFTKLLRYRGHTIEKESHDTCVLIDGIHVAFDLREAYKRILATTTYGSSDLVPTGVLVVQIGKYSRVKEWRDGKSKIEELLAKIMAKMEIYAELEKIQKEETRLWSLKYEEEKKQKEEIKQRRNEEVEKVNNLVALSEQYNKALLIRNFIEARKQQAINENNFNSEIQDWIIWATDKADWLDPLFNKSDNLLDD